MRVHLGTIFFCIRGRSTKRDCVKHANDYIFEQEAQLMLTTGSTRLAVSRGQQTWYHYTCYMWFPIVQ